MRATDSSHRGRRGGSLASRASGHAGSGVLGTEPQPFVVDGAPDGQLDGLATSRGRSFQACCFDLPVGDVRCEVKAPRPTAS
jgi:hypothetical protein